MKQLAHKPSFPAIPMFFLGALVVYVVLMIRPAIYAHHQQEAFLFTTDFILPYLSRWGGPAELMGKLFMQFLYRPLPGVLALLLFMVLWTWTNFRLFSRIYRGPLTPILSLLPTILAMILLNNHNFPFSVHLSMLLLSGFALLLYSGPGKLPASIFAFLAGSAALCYISGPAYGLLFVLMAMGLPLKLSGSRRWILVAIVLATGLLIWQLAGDSLRFYPAQVYFKDYVAPKSFYLYLLMPILLLPINRLGAGLKSKSLPLLAASLLIPVILAVPVHNDCYSSDAAKVVASDYFAHVSDSDRTAKAASSLEEYNLAANLNYNLVMAKTGQLSDRFFNFFQIGGSSSLQPDLEFTSELAFISAEYYYHLGFISEARHWAYEALVFYPHSPRALELLTKVHLILGEYPAAQRCLNILDKGMVKRQQLREFEPLLSDTTRVASHAEIREKRRCIPVQKELNPYMDQRLLELLEANPENTLAMETLLLYYMLDGDLDAFSGLWNRAGKQRLSLTPVFEEALLTHSLDQGLPSGGPPAVSQDTRDRYRDFSAVLKQYEGKGTMARNILYQKMGKSYFFYLQFLHPRIIKPQLLLQEYDEAPI